MAKLPPNPGEPDRAWLDHRDHAHKTHLARRPSLRERERDALLRDWYGEALAVGEALEHRSRARTMADLLPKALATFNAQPVAQLSDLQAHWADLVGVDVARQSRPAALQGDRLTIDVQDSTWLYILDRMHKKQIQERVVQHTGGQVKFIHFKVLGQPEPAPNRFRRPMPPSKRP